MREPEKIRSIDAEYLSGRRFSYQENLEELEDVDLLAATPGEDINWLEDVTLLEEEGVPAPTTTGMRGATRPALPRRTRRSRRGSTRSSPDGGWRIT